MDKPIEVTDAELLPCPFCGSEAILSQSTMDERSGYNIVYTIGCGTCGAIMQGRSRYDKNGWIDDPRFEGRAALIAAWNIRTPSTGTGAREILARVRAIVDAACDCARNAEREANRKSRESGNSDGAWFHHGRHMAAGCISEDLEKLEVEFDGIM